MIAVLVSCFFFVVNNNHAPVTITSNRINIHFFSFGLIIIYFIDMDSSRKGWSNRYGSADDDNRSYPGAGSNEGWVSSENEPYRYGGARSSSNDRLTDDPFVDASDVDVEVKECEVILTGTVDSRDAKRRSETIAESVSGVMHVETGSKLVP